MSMHNKMAHRAKMEGRTSEEFKLKADQHAKASWMSLIAAGIVWYFAGWGWALIPGVFVILSIAKTISATMVASRLEVSEQDSIRES